MRIDFMYALNTLFAALEQQARQRGVQVETLVNLWLQQGPAEQEQHTVGSLYLIRNDDWPDINWGR